VTLGESTNETFRIPSKAILLFIPQLYFTVAENLRRVYIIAHFPLASRQSPRHLSSTSLIISLASSSEKFLRNELRTNKLSQSYSPVGNGVIRGVSEIWPGSNPAVIRSYQRRPKAKHEKKKKKNEKGKS